MTENKTKRGVFVQSFWGKVILAYTLGFIVILTVILSRHIAENRMLISSSDGIRQHYRFLIWYGIHLRDILKTLWEEHRLVIPQYNFYLGEGNDILRAFSCYWLADPLSLLAVFVPAKYTHYLYNALIIFRMYLTGISFLYMCAEFNIKNPYGLLAGAFSYTFCLWNIYSLGYHYLFFTAVIYFPLIISGVEKILTGRSPLLFYASVALSSLTSIYFFYMQALLTVLYTLLVCVIRERYRFWDVVRIIAKVGIWALLGMFTAGIVVYPEVLFLLEDSRANEGKFFFLFYPIRYYFVNLPQAFLGKSGSYWLRIGLSSTSSFALILLWIRKKDKGFKKILFIVCFLFLLFPIFGQILNTLSYRSHKWIWGFMLMTSFNLSGMWDSLFNLSHRDKRSLYFFILLMGTVPFLFRAYRERYVVISIAILSVTCMVITSNQNGQTKLNQTLVLILTCYSLIIVNGFSFSKKMEKTSLRGMLLKMIFFKGTFWIMTPLPLSR